MANRKKNKFFKFYIVYLIILIVIGIYIITSVYRTMVELKNNTPNTFIENNLNNLSDDKIKELFNINSEYEDERDAINNVKDFLKGKNYTIKKVEKNNYDIYNEENKLLNVKLETVKSINKLGLLNYDVLKLGEITKTDNNGIYNYDIYIPSNFVLLVNGNTPNATEQTKIVEFKDGYDYSNSIPLVNHYVLSNLTKKPNIEITSNGVNVLEEQKYSIDFSDKFAKYNTLEEAGIDFNALEFSKNWSLFLTADLGGGRNGYNTLSTNLIQGTDLNKKAYDWATGIDITFTSVHRLNDPPFTDEEVSEITKYSDDAFSVRVKFKKHMTLKTGDYRVDEFDSFLYVIRIDGVWKVVNIKGVENG